MSKWKYETKFHSVRDTNHEQGGEILDMDKQIDLNLTTSSLTLCKVTQQFNGSPIPTFIYTNDTVKAFCAKASLPDPINVNFLNEYGCVLEFTTDFDLHKITMTLQQLTQLNHGCFSFCFVSIYLTQGQYLH